MAPLSTEAATNPGASGVHLVSSRPARHRSANGMFSESAHLHARNASFDSARAVSPQELLLDTQEVTGSSPVSPIRASPLFSRAYRFASHVDSRMIRAKVSLRCLYLDECQSVFTRGRCDYTASLARWPVLSLRATEALRKLPML